MNTTEKLDLLDKFILEKERQQILIDVEYRTLTSMVMASSKKDENLLAKQHQTKQTLNLVEVTIRQARGMRDEIKNAKES